MYLFLSLPPHSRSLALSFLCWPSLAEASVTLMNESGFCHIKLHSFSIKWCQLAQQAALAGQCWRTHQTVLLSLPGFKYTQVNGGSNKQRGDTASASCPLLLNFPQTNLCCRPLRGTRWQSAPLSLVLVWLALSLHLPFFTSQGHPNETKAARVFSSPRKLIMNKPSAPDNKLAGWEINSRAWSLGIPSLREQIRDTTMYRVSSGWYGPVWKGEKGWTTKFFWYKPTNLFVS